MTDRLQVAITRSLPGFQLDMQLDLPAEGVTAIYGPSGSGKTSLLRAIAGLDPVAGEINYRGKTWLDSHRSRPISVPCHQRHIGYVFQESSLLSHLDVAGNIAFARRRCPRRLPADEEVRILTLLGIEPLLTKPVAVLSGGERQRVAIARALISNPSLLLMDEPLAALDDTRRRDILALLKQVKAHTRVPMLYVSHNNAEVAYLADQLVLVDNGQVTASGALADTLVDHLLAEPMVVLTGEVAALHEKWQMAEVRLVSGQSAAAVASVAENTRLWLPASNVSPGDAVRLQILARDVSISLSPAKDSSIQNILPACIEKISQNSNCIMVTLRVNGQAMLAQLSLRALSRLPLTEGLNCWVQVKSVALI
ncbi:Sulfate/thiosulfate import ATP-binding protein CysA [BD1-7 clade bacterium]|uniref:Sulfate/thiosulfate import ATP-binding protein CysA n=1 Tax=BD1-7 clade bacterium TaxID=2029982 RepID=A0A5S9MUD8_9GAMM|nr:Sulfate/thiosulfate import ATP-binding protein CysA [BD1-7 clade bacterium]CAA0083703.1 Sulfate/thiosulfate import ATP-binding protein CysA [BD1-7 clade bacterium]